VIPEPIEQAITEYGLAAAYAGRYNDSHYRADEMKTERAALVAVIAAELKKVRVTTLEGAAEMAREEARMVTPAMTDFHLGILDAANAIAARLSTLAAQVRNGEGQND
jgi:hypothetical protein